MNTVFKLALAVIIGVIVTALLDNYWAGHQFLSFLLGVLAFLLVYFGDPLARR